MKHKCVNYKLNTYTPPPPNKGNYNEIIVFQFQQFYNDDWCEQKQHFNIILVKFTALNYFKNEN